MKNVNNNKPKLFMILAIVLAVALVIGLAVWAMGGQEQPDPSEPSGTSTQPNGGGEGSEPTGPNGGEPSGPNGGEPSGPNGDATGPNGDPTEPGDGTNPGGEATGDPTDGTNGATSPSDSGSGEPSEPADGTEPIYPTDPTVTNPPEPTDPTVPTGPVGEPPASIPPEPTTEPTEAPKPTEPSVTWEPVSETVYAKSSVNVRTGPSTSYDKLGQLQEGEAVKRVAIGSNGWSKVEYNGKEAYVSSNYLTTSKPQPTEPKDEEEFLTMYVVNDAWNYTGPGLTYDRVELMPAGTPVLVVVGSENNGWVKIFNASEYYYMNINFLSSTRPNAEPEPTLDPDDPWSRYVQDANIETGISWDGESPILYTYPDGTTGYELKDGATYEKYPGRYATYHEPEDREDDPYWTPEGHLCRFCGKLSGDGTNGTCMHKLVDGVFICEFCGEEFLGNTCHTCDED